MNLIALEALQDCEKSRDSIWDDASSEDEEGEQAIVERIMTIMRGSFEKKTWQAFWRTAVDGCSPDDVAAELEMTRWGVYKARARVLQKLRDELAGLEELE